MTRDDNTRFPAYVHPQQEKRMPHHKRHQKPKVVAPATLQKPKVVVPLPIKGQVGAGDVVKKVTTALGIKPCTPCEERRKRLNKALAFGRRQG